MSALAPSEREPLGAALAPPETLGAAAEPARVGERRI